MFKTWGSVTHDYWKPVLMDLPVVQKTFRTGAIVTRDAATNTMTGVGALTNKPVWGIVNGPVSATDTKVTVELCPTGTVLLADVFEILNGTVLTLTGGSTTTAVINTLVAGTNGVFVGMRFQIVSAANSELNGRIVTVTSYTSSSGTLGFSALPAALAANDTIRILSLDNDYVAGWVSPGHDTSNFDSIKLNQTASTSGLFRCIGTNENGTKLKLVLLNGIDSQKGTA